MGFLSSSVFGSVCFFRGDLILPCSNKKMKVQRHVLFTVTDQWWYTFHVPNNSDVVVLFRKSSSSTCTLRPTCKFFGLRFLKKQPDWMRGNPEVISKICQVMSFKFPIGFIVLLGLGVSFLDTFQFSVIV